MNDKIVEIEVLEGGKLPSKAHPSDAGLDVFATSDVKLTSGVVVKHPLNIRIKFPKGVWGRIETKSGLGAKGMITWSGIIDSCYRGIPHVIATNLTCDGKIEIKAGQKLAQLILEPYSPDYIIVQIDHIDTATERGEGGFGSSGK